MSKLRWYEQVKKKDIHIVSFFKIADGSLKGKLASFVVVELTDVKIIDPQERSGIFRALFIVPGNAKHMRAETLFFNCVAHVFYVMYEDEHTAKISDILTYDFDGGGLSRSLFAYAFREMKLKKYGIKKAYLFWDKKDKRALKLYLNLGFKCVNKNEGKMEVDLDKAAAPIFYVKTGWERK